jgi:hypothetical protein
MPSNWFGCTFLLQCRRAGSVILAAIYWKEAQMGTQEALSPFPVLPSWMWPQSSYETVLAFCFLTLKMGIITTVLPPRVAGRMKWEHCHQSCYMWEAKELSCQTQGLANFYAKGQVMNIWNFVHHIRSLLHIFFCGSVKPSKNVKVIVNSRTAWKYILDAQVSFPASFEDNR